MSLLRPRLLAAAAAGSVLAPAAFLATPSAAAAPVPTDSARTIACQTSTFDGYDWDAELSVTAQTDGTNTLLKITPNALPGVVPLNVAKAEIQGSIKVTVGGQEYSLGGVGSTAIVRNEPVPIPPVSTQFASGAASIDVTVTKIQYDMQAMGGDFPTLCPPAAGVMSWPIGPVAVETVASLPSQSPSPTPSPSSNPSPSPSASPTKDSGDKKSKNTTGVPAKGTVTFDCVLQELGSEFTYKPTVTVSGSRAAAGDSKVTLKARFSNIPGLAPVPIDNGTMKVTSTLKVGGKEVSLAESSSVNVPANAEVPVPEMTATMETDEETMPVEVTAFKFDFGEMQGMNFYSECTGSGALSKMTVGIGDDGSDDAGDTDSNSTTSSSALPKTGSGAPLAMIGLWSSALVLMAAALFLWLPRRNREA